MAHLGQQGRPYALRALLSSHRARGHDGDARAVALALLAEYPNTEHGLVGLAQEVEIALGANDVSAAQAALATMEADFPDEILTETTRAYFVLLAGEDALPARTAPLPLVAATSASASANTNADGFTLLPAYPNPFNPETQVVFEVGETTIVHLEVYDALGRVLAVLADGRYEPGRYTSTFGGNELASGLYVVRVTATPETSGLTQAYTERITLLK